MAKVKTYTIYTPQGRKLCVIKARKLVKVMIPKTIGFRPICEHGVER